MRTSAASTHVNARRKVGILVGMTVGSSPAANSTRRDNIFNSAAAAPKSSLLSESEEEIAAPDTHTTHTQRCTTEPRVSHDIAHTRLQPQAITTLKKTKHIDAVQRIARFVRLQSDVALLKTWHFLLLIFHYTLHYFVYFYFYPLNSRFSI